MKKASCKCISVGYDCPVCNMTFTNRHSRSRHVKRCVQENAEVHNTTTNNYSHSQVATTINNNTNNNTNNLVINNHIVYYNDHVIEFEDGHITRKDLKRIFNGASVKAVQAIAEYANRILMDETNMCVQKKHITNAYCDVRTEEGWICRPDKAVIERFSHDIAGSANDKLYDHPDIGTANVRRDVADIASLDEDAMEKTKDLYREIKSLIYRKTKQKEEQTQNADGVALVQ